METNNACNHLNAGDKIEWHVAQTLWDLVDDPSEYEFAFPDGGDEFALDYGLVVDLMRDCDDQHFRDFYDGSGSGAVSPSCSWVQRGHDHCAFATVAYENRLVTYNDPPTATAVTHTSFKWVNGAGEFARSVVSDPEGCSAKGTQYRFSTDNVCDPFDPILDFDTGGSNSGFLDPSVWSDGLGYVCLVAFDGAQYAFGAKTAQLGFDKTVPSTSVQTPVPSPSLGGVDVRWQAFDATSGLVYTELQVAQQPILGGMPSSSDYSRACPGISLNGGSISTVCTYEPTLPGTYCFRAHARDRAGNQATESASTTSCSLVVAVNGLP